MDMNKVCNKVTIKSIRGTCMLRRLMCRSQRLSIIIKQSMLLRFIRRLLFRMNIIFIIIESNRCIDTKRRS